MFKFTKYLAFISLIFLNAVYGAEQLTCPPVDAAGKLRIDPQARVILEKCYKQSPSTKSLYFDQKTQQYTPARQVLHDKIIQEILAKKPCVSAKPIAILTGGLPGSGKTTYYQKAFFWDHTRTIYHDRCR